MGSSAACLRAIEIGSVSRYPPDCSSIAERAPSRMRILIIPSDLKCHNAGDLAMLQVSLARLHALWPGAELRVLSMDPSDLQRQCPRATPVLFCHEWLTDQFLLGRFAKWLPGVAVHGLIRAQTRIWNARPNWMGGMIGFRMSCSRTGGGGFRSFLRALRTSDVVVACGSGGLGDGHAAYSTTLLGCLALSRSYVRATAMFSHGFVPLSERNLRRRALRELPGVDIIALREDRIGPALLRGLGLPAGREVVTGDDAIELAQGVAAADLGADLGINLRVARNADMEAAWPPRLRAVIHTFAQERGAGLVPLPIAGPPHHDRRSIEQILEGYPTIREDAWNARTPVEVARQAGRCRLVVTGAYHSAVFALSQGIPTICLYRSEYYAGKFGGLERLFGEGCRLHRLDGEESVRELGEFLRRDWDSAPRVRPSLRAAAASQVDAGRNAYGALRELVERRRGN